MKIKITRHAIDDGDGLVVRDWWPPGLSCGESGKQLAAAWEALIQRGRRGETWASEAA